MMHPRFQRRTSVTAINFQIDSSRTLFLICSHNSRKNAVTDAHEPALRALLTELEALYAWADRAVSRGYIRHRLFNNDNAQTKP